MRMRAAIFLAQAVGVLVGSLAGGFALAQTQEPVAAAEIEYAYPNQSVWTTRRDEWGEPDNPLLRLAAVLFTKAGVPWHGKAYPAGRLFEHLRNGTAEFSMLVKAPVLQECCLVSQRPVAKTELRIYRV